MTEVALFDNECRTAWRLYYATKNLLEDTTSRLTAFESDWNRYFEKSDTPLEDLNYISSHIADRTAITLGTLQTQVYALQQLIDAVAPKKALAAARGG
jgi:hypothetical protein